MDAYFASIEQRDNPKLRGKAIAVGGSERRGVVSAASYEARPFGVRSALPGAVAKRLCPELIFVKPRFDIYVRDSKIVMNIFRQFTDLVEPMSLDEAYLDVTDYCVKNNITAYKVAKLIRAKILKETNLVASAGVSFNKFLAKIASDFDKPDGLFVIQPQDADKFIDTLPIEKVPGIGKVTANKMKEIGIVTCLDIKKNDISFMAHHFGKSGIYFYDLLHLKIHPPVVSSRIRKSIAAERTFGEDVSDIELMLSKLKEIAEKLSNSMIKKDIAGKTITLKIKYYDFNLNTRSKTITQFVNDQESIYETAKDLLYTPVKPFKSVRLLGISISNLNTAQKDINYLQLKLDI